MLEKKKNGIQSIDVGFSIISVLINSQRPMPLKRISEKSGLTPSKIHSYLVSFQNIGLVERDEYTGFYRLGKYCLNLGLGYMSQMDLLSSSQPIMEQLANDLGHSIFLGVWGNHGPTIVNRVDGRFSQYVLDLRIGSVLPILTSALGKNFAAHLPEPFVKPYIVEEINRNSHRSDYIKSYTDAKAILDKVKIDGMSTSRGQILTDYTAISVPVLDYTNTIYVGLTIMGRIDSLDDSFDGETAKILKAAGEKLSELRGWKKKQL